MNDPIRPGPPADTRRSRLHDVFSEAVEIPLADRNDFVAHACRDDHDLRAEVQQLLSSHDRAGKFLSDPLVSIDPLLIDQSRRRIGPYQLQRVIGEGGYGTVYLAEQDKPLRRSVAIKVIRAGRDTRQTLARFDLERLALARMDHPNIARVFDAGTTADGRPYFVMEWVDGQPITAFCRAKKLDLPGRLTIFRDVCSAVQDAHQKGIIHRDLKPSNILMCERDGLFIPKVIDFGIAKAVSGAGDTLVDAHRAGDDPAVTQDQQLLGTPQYMSPEQVGDDPRDIDTRADVYALGAVLYELLTDVPPFDAGTLRSAAAGEVRRILTQVEPPRPSVRTPANRTPRELDWVVLKAIEKDRVRRYATAEALSADVLRFLTDKPVEAGPPTARYQISKFIRRHRRMVVMAVVVFLSLAGGMTAASIGFVRAAKARDRATAAEARASDALVVVRHERDRALAAEQREAVQRRAAEANAARVFSAQQFIYDLVVTPIDKPEDAAPLQMLDYLAKIASKGLLSAHPEVLSTLHLGLATAYQRMSRSEQTIQQLRRYLALQPDPLPDSINNEAALDKLGVALFALGNDVDSRPLFQKSLEMYRRLKHGRDDVDDAPILEMLGLSMSNTGDRSRGEAMLRKAVDLYHTSDPPGGKREKGAMQELAQVLDAEAKHEEAARLWEQTRDFRPRPQTPATRR
jgi:serine/threonine protein kinase/tetratricopeptide (TPR) repeat protein